MPKVVFISGDGKERREVQVAAGMSVLEISRDHDIDIEGACEGCMACSTCHVIVEPEFYARLPEPGEEEIDMLDLAFGLTKTSRLGCQLVITDDLDGIVLRLPPTTRNLLLA